MMDRKGGLEAPQKRLEEAAAAVKATLMATRNKNKFQVPAEIRQMATEVARCRNPILRKDLRKKRGRPGDKLMPGRVPVPEVFVSRRLLYEKCYEDKDETSI